MVALKYDDMRMWRFYCMLPDWAQHEASCLFNSASNTNCLSQWQWESAEYNTHNGNRFINIIHGCTAVHLGASAVIKAHTVTAPNASQSYFLTASVTGLVIWYSQPSQGFIIRSEQSCRCGSLYAIHRQRLQCVFHVAGCAGHMTVKHKAASTIYKLQVWFC